MYLSKAPESFPKRSLEKICVFKELEKSNGTTFQDIKRLVKEEKENHPLYKCIQCEGYKNTGCRNYKKREDSK